MPFKYYIIITNIGKKQIHMYESLALANLCCVLVTVNIKKVRKPDIRLLYEIACHSQYRQKDTLCDLSWKCRKKNKI